MKQNFQRKKFYYGIRLSVRTVLQVYAKINNLKFFQIGQNYFKSH